METREWFYDQGDALIKERLERYSGKEIGQIWLSNFDLVPEGVKYEELAELIKCPCRYIPEYDDIILMIPK